MAHRARLAAAVLALLALGSPAGAQSPEPALPRVIYGQTEPSVIYGPSSPAPELAPPRIAIPQAATAPPPQPPADTSLSYGWVPAGPPIWFSHRGLIQPPRPRPHGLFVRSAPRFDNSFERPLPQGRYVGTPPSALREPRPHFRHR